MSRTGTERFSRLIRTFTLMMLAAAALAFMCGHTAYARSRKGADESISGSLDQKGRRRQTRDAAGNETASARIKSKKQRKLRATNIRFEASGMVAQEKKIRMSYKGDGEPEFFSDSNSVTVTKGKVRVSPFYYGKARITIIIPETDNYASASKQIEVYVSKVDNSITASDIVQDFSEEEQTVDLEAKGRGGAKLHYESDNPEISVVEGRARIPACFNGKAKITISAKSSGIYKKASKTITLTVLSGTARQLYTVAKSQIGVSGHGKNSTVYGQYTGMNRQAWCASFVSWCAGRAGVKSSKPGTMSMVPKTASTLSMCKYSTGYRTWGQNSLERIKQGDVIFFSRMSKLYEYNGNKVVCHVGIVESVDPDARKITVIEGNSTGDRVCRHSYYVNRETGKAGKRYFCGYISVK